MTEYRMYTMALYQLSPMQAAIQAGHSWVEYGVKTKDNKDLYDEWAHNHKTVIVLNGGTTQTMRDHMQYLSGLGVECIEFKEPDLDNLTTAFSFIVSDRVFNPKYFESEPADNSNGIEVAIGTYLRKFKLHGLG